MEKLKLKNVLTIDVEELSRFFPEFRYETFRTPTVRNEYILNDLLPNKHTFFALYTTDNNTIHYIETDYSPEELSFLLDRIPKETFYAISNALKGTILSIQSLSNIEKEDIRKRLDKEVQFHKYKINQVNEILKNENQCAYKINYELFELYQNSSEKPEYLLIKTACHINFKMSNFKVYKSITQFGLSAKIFAEAEVTNPIFIIDNNKIYPFSGKIDISFFDNDNDSLSKCCDLSHYEKDNTNEINICIILEKNEIKYFLDVISKSKWTDIASLSLIINMYSKTRLPSIRSYQHTIDFEKKLAPSYNPEVLILKNSKNDGHLESIEMIISTKESALRNKKISKLNTISKSLHKIKESLYENQKIARDNASYLKNITNYFGLILFSLIVFSIVIIYKFS